MAGCYLPADIFARYHRLKGNRVLMVSGSDMHGTPIMVTAQQEGAKPEEVALRYHKLITSSLEEMGISFDLFTHTHTPEHEAVVHEILGRLDEAGFIEPRTTTAPYDPKAGQFLPDRYVEGTCPHCKSTGARGDQCDECGKTLDADELIDPHPKLNPNVPLEFRETEHLFFRLSAFREQLLEWLSEGKGHWKSNVLKFTRNWLEEGLVDRAITRDLEWGVPVPRDGYESKRIYVWFEAVMGYYSASRHWAQLQGDDEAWRKWWDDPEAEHCYFMAKDNIPFHTIIWPAMLMGYGDLNLPYDVPANEYMNLEGLKLSTSRNWAVWLPDYLDRYEPDPLRYFIAASMPETSDSDFSWSEYVRRNNDELVATYGNLVHRVLTMTYRNFDGRVPESGELDDAARGLLAQARSHFDEVSASIEACRFRLAIQSAMALARETNRYLDQEAPWRSVRTDKDDAARTLWTSIAVINCLKTLLYPFLPFSSEKLHTMLGLDGSVRDAGWSWDAQTLAAGERLEEPVALFTKLEDAVVEEEAQRVGR